MDLETLADIHRAYRATPVVRDIAPDDEMWRTGAEWYFQVGESGLGAILRALAFSPLERVETILDLPCGHGRVARHLRAAFPRARITYCDLVPSGVDFCRKTFGGEGVLSRPDLLQTPLGRYELIWVGSLFTHVSRRRTAAWLARLCTHLSPDGLLVATFHGSWTREVHKRFRLISGPRFLKARLQCSASGYGYVAYPGSEHGAYGVSLSTPPWILALAGDIPGVRILGYTERGWADNHDVLALGRTDRCKAWSGPAELPRRRRPGAGRARAAGA